MSSRWFENDKVVGVLLPAGWVGCVEGSFTMEAVPTLGPVRRRKDPVYADDEVWDQVARWLGSDGLEYTAPVELVAAVRVRPPK